MFKKDNTAHEGVDSLVGVNTTFTGNISSEGSIRVDGRVNGDVKTAGDVFIGDGGTVSGNIEASNVTLAGTAEGNITARDVLKILSSAKLYGDIKIGSFIADEGAIFQGKCSMLEDTAVASITAEKGLKRNYKKSAVIDDPGEEK